MNFNSSSGLILTVPLLTVYYYLFSLVVSHWVMASTLMEFHYNTDSFIAVPYDALQETAAIHLVLLVFRWQ